MTISMRNDIRLRIYVVGDVARLSGVSVRTLHHYHDIGLLRPALVGENGYRFYGRAELMRLQQILLYRELGLSLAEISAVLDDPNYDRLGALRRQRAHLKNETARFRQLIQTIDRTIAELQGETTMADCDIYKGFAPAKQAEYETWLGDRFGDEARRQISAGKQRMSFLTASDMKAELQELEKIEGELADAFRGATAPDDPSLASLVQRHHAWIAKSWGKPPNRESYEGLGQLYAEHPDFRARYESIAPGLTDWLRAAMTKYASQMP